ncbi:MAG: hydroxyacid dehydrogenase [Actinobacteria bacterium]|nr:MAG: hydroxyacid dehydrogenase [Actinomycetota bacterium]
MTTLTSAIELIRQKKANPIRIAFFEVEDWEIDFYRHHLPLYDLIFYPEELDAAQLEEIKQVNVLCVRIRSRVTADVINNLSNLQLIVTRSTGFDHVDLAEAAKRNIAVTNVPTYGENTVAEHAFALILALAHNVHKAYMRTLTGDFEIKGLKGFDLSGKTLGVVGTGRIGLHAIKIARGLDMNVLAYDPMPHIDLQSVLGFKYVAFDELLHESDIVTLHAPYNKKTHHLMNRDTVVKMKKGAVLINTARGGLVDNEALVWALEKGILSGAGLDVLEGEDFINEEWQAIEKKAQGTMKQLLEDHVLMKMDNVIITPHIAFYSKEAYQRIAETTVENIEMFFSGEPMNMVEAA